MHPQLQAVADHFDSASERLQRLRATVPRERFAERPPEGGWSPAECVAHLNLTARAFIPLLERAIRQARALNAPAPTRHRRGLVGWLLWKATGPGGRIRARTSTDFEPGPTEPLDELFADFERLQVEQLRLLREADGLPLGRVSLASPFDARVKYDAYAAFTILPNHQHRHLAQAERAWEAASATTR
jgi:hypothetical protein